jgi:hypothetical protein
MLDLWPMKTADLRRDVFGHSHERDNREPDQVVSDGMPAARSQASRSTHRPRHPDSSHTKRQSERTRVAEWWRKLPDHSGHRFRKSFLLRPGWAARWFDAVPSNSECCKAVHISLHGLCEAGCHSTSRCSFRASFRKLFADDGWCRPLQSRQLLCWE